MTYSIRLLVLAGLFVGGSLPCRAVEADSDTEAVAERSAERQPPSWSVQEMSDRVDTLLVEDWADHGIEPAARSSDSEFLRRAYLDLVGVIPTVADTRTFLDSSNPQKRSQLINQLLDSPRHATHLANTWRNILIPDGFDANMAGRGAAGMQKWLRGRFQQNMRYDRMVGDFLTATGSAESGPALYYQALEAKPEKLATSTARIFLGLQLGCAQCHDHPFDDWSQTDFWGYAAFFAQVEGRSRGDQFVLTDVSQGEVVLPEMDEVVPPQFPGGSTPETDRDGTRRLQLSIWMSSQNNPFLARAAVNRVWSLLFGRGLVNPVDDMKPENQPTHPKVLEDLSAYFVQSEYNLRDLFRVLANTRAYQLTSCSPSRDLGEQRRQRFAQMGTKALTAEQLFDSLQRCLHLPNNGNQSSNVVESPQRQQFVSLIETRTRDATEYGAGIQQTLNLMNGRGLSPAIDQSGIGILASLEAPFFQHDSKLDTIFLASLTRHPTEKERQAFAANTNPEDYGDLLWAILNSAEFRFNH